MAKKKAKRLRPKKLESAEQHARFVETAKKVGADEAPDAMDKAFKKLNPRRT
jgi:hypothetical protein